MTGLHGEELGPNSNSGLVLLAGKSTWLFARLVYSGPNCSSAQNYATQGGTYPPGEQERRHICISGTWRITGQQP